MKRSRIFVAGLAVAALVTILVAPGSRERLTRIWQEWLLRHGGRAARVQAAERLGRRADPASVPALVAALGDEVLDVRCHALWGLGAIGDPDAIEPVRARLASTDPTELRYAAFASSLLGDRAALPRIVEIGDGARDEALLRGCMSAAGVLGGPEAVPFLARYVADEREPVRAHAAAAIGNVRSFDALAPLMGRLDVEPSADVRAGLDGSLRQLFGGGGPEARPAGRAEWKAWAGRRLEEIRAQRGPS